MAVRDGKEAGRHNGSEADVAAAGAAAGRGEDDSAERLTRFFAGKTRGGRESAERSRMLRKVLPWVTGVVLAIVLAWPFISRRSDSITLSYRDLVSQGEQVRIIGAHYAGTDAKGRPFDVKAAEGMQERTDSDYATLTRVEARMQLNPEDSVAVSGGTGAYDRARDHLGLAGGIRLTSSSGYKLETPTADVDLATNTATGNEAVLGTAPFGSFSARGFTLDLDERRLVLQGGVRVKLDPGKRTTDPVKAPADVPAPNTNSQAKTKG